MYIYIKTYHLPPQHLVCLFVRPQIQLGASMWLSFRLCCNYFKSFRVVWLLFWVRFLWRKSFHPFCFMYRLFHDSFIWTCHDWSWFICYMTHSHKHAKTCHDSRVSPAPEKTRLDIVIGMEIEILDAHRDQVSCQMSLFKRDLWRPSRISISISTTISSLIFSGTGCAWLILKHKSRASCLMRKWFIWGGYD